MMTRRQFVAAAVGLAGVSRLPRPTAHVAPWRRGADAPTRPSEVAAAVLGERISVVGGFGAGTGAVVEILEP
jgi:hypothetical protein